MDFISEVSQQVAQIGAGLPPITPTVINLLWLISGGLFTAVLSKTHLVSENFYKYIRPPIEIISYYYTDGDGSFEYISIDGKPPPFLVGGPERLTISRNGFNIGRDKYFSDVITIVNKSEIPIPVTRFVLSIKPESKSGAFKETFGYRDVDWQRYNWVGAFVSIDSQTVETVNKLIQELTLIPSKSRIQLDDDSIEIPLKFDPKSVGFVLKPQESRTFLLAIVPIIPGMSVLANAKLKVKYSYKSLKDLEYRIQWEKLVDKKSTSS